MSQEKDEFDYKIGGDEDEEENYSGDDIYAESDDSNALVGAQDGEELDFYAITALNFADVVKWSPPKLRQELFEENLKEVCDSKGLSLHDLIISCDKQDDGYIEFIAALYPALDKFVRQVANPAGRETLIDVFGTTLSATIWNSISSFAEKNGMSIEKFCTLANSIYGGDTFQPPESDGTSIVEFINSVGINPFEASVHDSSVVSGDLALLKAIVEGAEVPVQEEKVETPPVLDTAPEVDDMEVRSVVNAILKVYDSLYAPCFINRPLGVLTSDGVLKQDFDGSVEIISSGVNYAKRLYSFINNQTKDYLGDSTTSKTIDSSFISANGTLLCKYSPLYHLRNINGIKEDGSQVKTWAEFRQYLFGDLTKKVKSVLSKVTSDDTIAMQSVLISLFTNCIIIDKFDVVSSMSLKMRIDGYKGGLGNAVLANTKQLFAKDFGEIINEGVDAFGIYDLLYVFDVAAYTSEILFSYKAHESLIASGNAPSISNVVVGKGLDGKDITVNLGNELNVSTGIVAGSGSGKGVLTLNILASLFAEGCPVMYLDFKPDMAGTLWQMERYLQSKGYNSRIFSIDSKEDRRKDGATPVRSYPYGYKNTGAIPLTTVEYGLFPYLKSLQFMVLLATARSKGILPRKDKMFFILDETQGFSRSYLQMLKKLQEMSKDKAIKKDSDEGIFANKLANAFGAELKTELANVRDVTGRTGLMGMILLGQKVDPEEWKVMFGNGDTSSWKESFAALLMASVNLKFVGKNAGTSPGYGIGNVQKKGINYVDDKDIRGYWALSGTVKPTTDSTTIFKSYLTLNDNDFNDQAYVTNNLDVMPYTGGVLSGIKDDIVKQNVINDEFKLPNGSIRDTIGFLGLMKLIGGADEASLAEKVSRGYGQMEAMFNILGLNQRYANVEEYLYDCSPESIFTIAELRDIMNGSGASVDNLGGSVPSVGKDWLGETQPAQPFGVPSSTGTGVPAGFEQPFGDLDADEHDEVPDLLDDETDSSQQHNPQPEQRQTSGQRPTRQEAESAPYTPPSDRSGYSDVYQEDMLLPQNPFRLYGTSDKPISALNSIKMMSKYIMDEILRFTGDYRRIESFEVTETGLVINNIAFRPRFEEYVIESMPFDIRKKVASGNIVELFHFDNIRKFRNLSVLRIDNSRLAEGRVRREIGLHPRRTWAKLFDWYPSLSELYIGGERITDQETAQQYDDRGRGGFSLTEKLRNAFGMSLDKVSNSRMERMWESRPVRVMTGAVGWTLGVKTVALAASFFGPWGLLFGAFAGYGAYRELRNRREGRK